MRVQYRRVTCNDIGLLFKIFLANKSDHHVLNGHVNKYLMQVLKYLANISEVIKHFKYPSTCWSFCVFKYHGKLANHNFYLLL